MKIEVKDIVREERPIESITLTFDKTFYESLIGCLKAYLNNEIYDNLVLYCGTAKHLLHAIKKAVDNA